MRQEDLRDAAATMQELEIRLFNRDSESLMIERLGSLERRWAHAGATRPCDYIAAVAGVLDSWLIPDLVLPDGPLEKHESVRVHEWTEEERQRMRLMDDKKQLLNSFGLGVFLGASLHRALVFFGEAGKDSQIFGCDFSLLDAVYALEKAPLTPADLTCDDIDPWFRKLQRWMILARPRLGLDDVFASIVSPAGAAEGGLKRLSYRELRRARRSMLLAGLISSGFSLPNQELCDSSSELLDEVEPDDVEECVIDLFNLSDQELEAMLGEMHLRESIKEELRFRLRSSRLSRMLAHLERASKDEHEDNGAAGDE
jgi:hypothetical protein